MADAFVDRTVIDWAALLNRVQSGRDLALFENLSLLDRMRRPALQTPTASRTSARHFPVTRLVVTIAALQTICALGALGSAWLTGGPASYRMSQVVLALAFAAASLLLGAATLRDRRSLFLLAAFASVASAFARAPLLSLPETWSAPLDVIFRGVFPEAFAPACVWRFAVDFPQVRRFTPFDVLARRTTNAAWLLGIALFGVNVAIGYGLIDTGPAIRLGRNHPDNLFWHLFALAMLPALGTILMRSRGAPFAERRRVARFALAIAAGAAPLLLSGLVRMLLPRVDHWLVRAGQPRGLWLDMMIMGPLAAMPILSTLAVIVDRPFGRQAIRFNAWRNRMATVGLTAIVSAPFTALLLTLYRLRHVAIADVVSGPGAWFLLACGAVGWLLVATRVTLLEALQSRGLLRQAASYQEGLGAALERVRLARGAREIGVVLDRELRQGVGATTVSVLAPHIHGVGGAGPHFVDQCGDAVPLASDAALLAMLGETTKALDLSSDGPLFPLLPRKDRDWVIANGVALAAPLKRRDGAIAAVVLFGPKQGDRTYDRRDRWLMSVLVAGAASAWDVYGPGTADRPEGAISSDPADTAEAAFECRLCGLVAEAKTLACCGGDATLASLPRRLGAKFVVERRIGAGGMGVVYLGRDIALDRDVALKTLPDWRGGTVARLRDEARAMAGLNHESLATIYGLELWRRTPVLIVEYLPGGTLARRLGSGPLPAHAAVAIGIHLAGALAYMHARGVLHRDLKPSNIAFAATGAPKLLDFGLATLMKPQTSYTQARIASQEAFAGTAAYLPPEAYLGVPPDPAFDLWALALVMLQAITGRHPFASDQRGRPIHRTLSIDLAGVCPPLSDIRALTGFFERALALDPPSRFDTGLEMQSALERIYAPSSRLSKPRLRSTPQR